MKLRKLFFVLSVVFIVYPLIGAVGLGANIAAVHIFGDPQGFIYLWGAMAVSLWVVYDIQTKKHKRETRDG